MESFFECIGCVIVVFGFEGGCAGGNERFVCVVGGRGGGGGSLNFFKHSECCDNTTFPG